MAQTFKFELVSPEEKLISEDVAMVTVPGEEGVFGVLAGHSPLLSSLNMGVVEMRRDEASQPRRIFVSGGFADVGPKHCTVLAQDATDLTLVDVTKLEAEITKLQSDALAAEGFEKTRLEARLAVAQAKRAAL
ncbi:MAG: ATP synthase F1 subunit epsilon [Proteobacteria bacterium]|nr:ATP synthase F1 subunit epsilon [Pseudomonadota bacterium]